MGAVNVTGHEGQVRWSYLTAITFGPWSFTGTGQEGTLTAQIVSCDEFRASQASLVVVVPAGRAEWRWAVRDLQINGASLTVSVARL